MFMGRKKYSCDFETTTKEEDCRVWAYGWMEIGKTENFKIGNNIDEFMSWVRKSQADLYFHNLKFDGSFIVNWLLKNGFKWEQRGGAGTFSTLISNMGQWYSIDICYGYKGKRKIHTVIYDSLKKLPFTVKKIGKDFGLDVLKIDHGEEFYHRERPVGHEITEEEFAYIKNDIEVIACALDIQFKQGMDKMTTGSDSLNGYKAVISKKFFEKMFPVFSLKMDKEIRNAYRGGFTWVNEVFQGKEVGEGLVFDVNSLYPAQMYERDLPYGMPLPFVGEYVEDAQYPLYIQYMRCSFQIKEGYIPTIQLKKTGMFKDTEYLKSSDWEVVDLWVTNVDLELIREHYDLSHIEYVHGWKFRSKRGLFKEFIDKWMYIKTHSKGAIKQLAKLMLNSLYGKFCSNPNVTGKVPYLKEDGALGFSFGEEEYKDPIYTPMGTFITSWARYTTITTAQKCFDRILYCDTDSIHLLGTEIPDAIRDIIDEDKLGYWKHESTFEKAKFIRQKTYYEVIYAKQVMKEGELKIEECEPEESDGSRVHNVKCAGMPDNLKQFVTFENFEPGLVLDGKKMPKQVDGGVVLVNKKFTLKAVGAEREEETREKAQLSMFREELLIDPLKDLVKEHGWIKTVLPGERFYTEYKRIGRSEKMKYFRKTGMPIDVWADATGYEVNDLLEELGAY